MNGMTGVPGPEVTVMEEKHMDESLKGNEIIEEYIAMLQKEPSPELLSVVLTSVRRRMKAGGQMIVAVDANAVSAPKVQIMELPGGERWLPVFTSFEEQMKGNSHVMSTFLADIGRLTSRQVLPHCGDDELIWTAATEETENNIAFFQRV